MILGLLDQGAGLARTSAAEMPHTINSTCYIALQYMPLHYITYVCMYIYMYMCVCVYKHVPAPSNYPFRNPKHHLIETIRPLIEVHWEV